MKNSISQGLRLGQKVSKGFRKWLKDKMGKCVNCAKSVMQIFKLTKLTKLTEQIFATYATSASANFVGKESNESTVMYRVKSRITTTCLRLASDSHHSRSVCSPRTPSLFKAKSQLAFPQFSLASLICLCMLTIGSGNAWGAGSITVTSSAITLPNGSTSVGKGDWISAADVTKAGPNWDYSDWEGDHTIGSYGSITFSNAGDLNGTDYYLQLQASGGYIQTTINSPAGVDITIGLKKGSKGTLTVSLTGATNKNYTSTSWGSLSISTKNTSATLKVTKTGAKAAGIKYITITPKAAASCNTDPSAGTASLNGSFSLTSVGVTATDWDPGTNCTWDEKGFVWGSSANPTVSNNKVTVNTGTSATWDGALVPSGSTDPTSLSVGNTYHYRAYGKNGKEGATYVYSSDASFTPRSVTCESVTGGTISAGTEVSVSGKTITLTATPDSHFSFGSWTVTNNSTSATITVTNNQFTMPDANVTVTATFNEDAYKTVTFYNNSTNTGITGYTNMKVYVGDTPSEPTLTDGTSGDACDATSDKHYGWSRDTWSGTIDTEAHMTGSPGNHTVYQKGSVPAVVAGDPATISYHAVWAAGSQYWGRLTSSELSGLSAGTELVIVAVDQGYVLQNDLTCSNSVPAETDGKISPTDNIKWTLAGSAGAWQLKSGTDILGTKYNSCAGSGNGVVLAFNLYHQTYSIASSSHATNEFYIKDNACDYGVLTKVSKYDDIRIVNVSSYSSVASAALKLYIKKGSYSEFITNCCSASTLAFAASPYAVIRQNIGGASTTTWAEVDVTFTSNNTTGAISATTYTDGKTVYKLSSWEGRGTTGGTLCANDHAYFEVLTQPSGETPGTGKFHVKTTSGQTGQGTYRIALTQESTDESHGNFCETTAYGFVDVTLRDKFVDNVNGNGTINRDGHGAQLATPTLSELDTQDEDACHDETRKLKGWIKETDLKAQYETGSSTRVQTVDGLCETCADGTDQTSLIVAPGANVTMSGATWYAVWAYEK